MSVEGRVRFEATELEGGLDVGVPGVDEVKSLVL